MESTPANDRGGSRASAFNTTHWSVILQAGQESSALARVALESLCKAYRYPLCVHVRRLGWSPEDAADLTHEFLARFIERKYLQRADQKRGSGQQLIHWDGLNPEERYGIEPVEVLSPELAYEKRWAATLLKDVLGRLRTKCEPPEQREFDLLKNFVWGDGQPGTYADVAAALGIEEGNVKVKVYRLRARFRDQLRQEVLRTVSSPEEVDDELRHLRALPSG